MSLFLHAAPPCRYHSKALLVTFDSDNTASSHVDVLTREVQEGFKRMDGEIRAMAAGDAAGDDDAQVCVRSKAIPDIVSTALFELLAVLIIAVSAAAHTKGVIGDKQSHNCSLLCAAKLSTIAPYMQRSCSFPAAQLMLCASAGVSCLASPQVRLQVQRQLAQALFKLSVEFRKEETRFLNKMEAQKGLAAGSSIGLIEDEGHALGANDPGFTESQIQKVRRQVLVHRGGLNLWWQGKTL